MAKFKVPAALRTKQTRGAHPSKLPELWGPGPVQRVLISGRWCERHGPTVELTVGAYIAKFESLNHLIPTGSGFDRTPVYEDAALNAECEAENSQQPTE